MSNKRKVRPRRDAQVAAIAAAAECSDCASKSSKVWRRGEWVVTLHHDATCPAITGRTASIHRDAAAVVAKVAASAGQNLLYAPDPKGGWVLEGSSGTVTASPARS